MSEPRTESQNFASTPKRSCASSSSPAREQREASSSSKAWFSIFLPCHRAQLVLHHHLVQAYASKHPQPQPLILVYFDPCWAQTQLVQWQHLHMEKS